MFDLIAEQFYGIKCFRAYRAQRNNERLREGKLDLPFKLFRYLSYQAFSSGKLDLLFMKGFGALLLECLLQSIQYYINLLRTSCLARKQPLGFQKNDQDGSRSREPKHVYANPQMLEICPVLTLASYFAIVGFNDEIILFHGSQQYNRFQKLFDSFLKSPYVPAEPSSYGLSSRDLGSHSYRKGAGTFMSSGSTHCPSSTSIQLRMGWKLHGVQDRYFHYQSAGDQHADRTVAGLNAESEDFAVLPPRFAEHNEFVKRGIELTFPNAPPNLLYVLEFCLASLIY